MTHPFAIPGSDKPIVPKEPIRGFQGQYRFLSNFWTAEIEYEEITFPTVEHAYQAAKTHNIHFRKKIRDAEPPGKAKRLGEMAMIRDDWEGIKVDVMRTLVHQKFTRHPEMKRALLETGDRELIEENSHGDRFWGTVRGYGENWLGRILMEIRAELKETRNADCS